MPWWHENYLDKLDLYFHFTALANFTAGLAAGDGPLEPLVTLPRSSSTRATSGKPVTW